MALKQRLRGSSASILIKEDRPYISPAKRKVDGLKRVLAKNVHSMEDVHFLSVFLRQHEISMQEKGLM